MRSTTGIDHFQSAGESILVGNWRLLALCSLASLVLLWGLGRGSLNNYDEGMYGQIAKEIIAGGDWLTMHYEYKPWFEKPPLLMWSTAVFYGLFGVNEFWSRAASAFSGIGIVIVTYLIGKLIYDPQVGFFAGLVLLSNSYFVTSARLGMTDSMLTFFCFLSFYGYLRMEKGDYRWWYLIWTSCALAVMVKSAAGLIAPLVITLALSLDGRLTATWRSKHFWQGLALAIVIIAPWHIMMLIRHGRSFVANYIGYHVIARSTGLLEGHIGDRFYYIDRLHELFSPWFYLLPFSIALSIKEILKGQLRSRILLLVTILVFGLFTLVPTKIEWYILPICPALSIFVASMAVKAMRSHESISFSGLVMATFIVALLTPLYIKLAFAVAMLLVFGCIATRRLTHQAIGVVIFALFVVVGMHTFRSLYTQGESSRAKLARIAASTDPSDRQALIVFSPGDMIPPPRLWRPVTLFYSNRPMREPRTVPVLAFYSNRPTREARTLEDLEEFTNDQQTKRVMVAKRNVDLLLNDYEIKILAEEGPLVYGLIKHRG